jgi:hypothetical protein
VQISEVPDEVLLPFREQVLRKKVPGLNAEVAHPELETVRDYASVRIPLGNDPAAPLLDAAVLPRGGSSFDAIRALRRYDGMTHLPSST